MKHRLFLPLLLLLAAPLPGRAQGGNLVPNADFSDRANPLATFRYDFPFQGSYVKNAGYVKLNPTVLDNGGPSVELDLPKGVAENEGGKFESALIKIEPGATYHGSVDVRTADLAAKIFVEVYAVDPTSSPIGASIDRLPAANGLPALVKCYRATFDDPPAKSQNWVTVKRDFTVPANAIILGKPAPPVYATVKAFGLSTWVGGSGKVYFSRFTLTKIKSAPPSSNNGARP